MQPNSEPTPADVAMVAAAMGEPAAPAQPQPAPAPQPAQPAPAPTPAPQQQPAPVTPQPAPSQQQTDPFASLFASEPTAPAQPTAQPQAPTQPTQPTEPTSPTPQPQQPTEPTQPTQPQPQAQPQPGETVQPQAPAQPATPPADEYQTFDEYMASITQGLPPAPTAPDPDKIDPNDPAAIKSFFDDLVNTAVQRSNSETQRQNAIQTAERNLWEGAFTKYNSLRDNKPLRDMVHSIRMGYFQRGVAITPTQAADKLLDAMKAQYQRGVADNQVTTTIEQVQPTGGGSVAPVPTTMDTESTLTAVQTGGEQALAQILDAEIKAGRL